MKFNSLRTSLVGSAFALLAAVLLGSCGGGGGSSNNTGGNLQMFPLTGTFFAGVPATMTIVGGRRPYRLTSSEPGVLPVPSVVDDNTFTVIPNQPGVIDAGISEGELPVRTVLINATDAENLFQQSQIRVAQNFLTGYGFNLLSNCAPTTGSTVAAGACAGGETLVRVEANFNGVLSANRTFRLEVVRGPFFWVFPDGTIAGNTVTVTTDHEGKAQAIFRVPAGVGTQIAVFRIVDVESGASTEHAFIIQGIPIADALEIIPDEFTFTGPNSAACGTGSGQFLVFDGIPPYTAFSAFSEVTVTPTSTNAQPGIFTFNVSNPNVCLTDATIVVTDSRLARGTVTITTEPGEGDPPPPPLRAIPTSITLSCSAPMGSFIVAGGDPTATVAGSTSDSQLVVGNLGPRQITVTWNPGTPGGTNVPPTVTSSVIVTDGATTTNVTVRRPTTCS